MLKRPRRFALISIATTMWWSPEAVAGPSRQTQSPWVRTESRRFEVHYQRALGFEVDRVVRSAETAYDHVSRRLNFVLATKVPLIIFAPSGSMTQEQVVEYATGDQVAPPRPHRSRIVLPLADDEAQLETRLVHELTHLLAFEIVWPHRAGDGGIPRWVSEGLAYHMVGIWSDDDARVMRDLVGSGDIPAVSELTGRGDFATAHLNDAHRARRLRLHREPLGRDQHSPFSGRADRPARGQDLQRRLRIDAGGIRRGLPPVRRTPVQAGPSLMLVTIRSASDAPGRTDIAWWMTVALACVTTECPVKGSELIRRRVPTEWPPYLRSPIAHRISHHRLRAVPLGRSIATLPYHHKSVG